MDALFVLTIVLSICYGVIWLLMVISLLYFIISGGKKVTQIAIDTIELAMVGGLNSLLLVDDAQRLNTCCGSSAYFSPAHRMTPYVIIVVWTLAYFYCAYRKKLAPPLIEVLVNCLLMTGIVMDVLITFQDGNWSFGLMCLLPQMAFVIYMLIRNHRWVHRDLEQRGFMSEVPVRASRPIQFCWYLLRQILAIKIPVLLILCIPVLVCIVAILQLFGQQPDSLVRAFTDTYKHGLSQLTPNCNGVVCGEGHFLCTIAAKGDPKLVHPIRSGVRAGAPIKCNRQLLIANAFEEWLEQHCPALHRPIRRAYNHIGNYLHRHYDAFDRRWVSNSVYLLMKPLEWIFLLFLYLADRRPETRIAQQYLSLEDRRNLKSQLIH